MTTALSFCTACAPGITRPERARGRVRVCKRGFVHSALSIASALLPVSIAKTPVTRLAAPKPRSRRDGFGLAVVALRWVVGQVRGEGERGGREERGGEQARLDRDELCVLVVVDDGIGCRYRCDSGSRREPAAPSSQRDRLGCHGLTGDGHVSRTHGGECAIGSPSLSHRTTGPSALAFEQGARKIATTAIGRRPVPEGERVRC
jgi:hypothetical protein